MPNHPTPLLPGEMTEDPDLLDQAIQDLREIHLRKGLEYHLELGSYIIRTFFNDDQAAYARRATKHLSYRALATRENLPMSYATLNTAVRVRHQFDVLPEDVRVLPPTLVAVPAVTFDAVSGTTHGQSRR